MAPQLNPGEFETDRAAYEKNCRGKICQCGMGKTCAYFEGVRDAVDSTRVIIKCAIYNGIDAVVSGCPGPEKQSE